MYPKYRQMKALLAYPPFSLTQGWEDGLPFLDNMVCLGSFLKHNGVEVTVYHEHPYDITSFVQIIQEQQPDIVCLSCDSANFDSCVKFTALSKKIAPHTLTVWGGYHATFFDTKILEHVSSLDIIVRNEGELTLQEILNILQENPQNPCFKNVLGITYKNAGKIHKNQSRPVIHNLDTLPFYSYDLLDMNKVYHDFSWRGCYPIHTGRGCSFPCRFCADKASWGRNYRYKSPKKIIEEVKYCRDNYPIEGVAFAENLFTVNKARTKELCKLLIQEKIEIDWGCSTRVDLVDDDLLALMKESGCKKINYGVEHLSDKMLQLMKKGYSSDLAMDILRKTHAHGIYASFYLILGFPGETEKTLAELLTKINQLDLEINCTTSSIFQLQPGSDSYNEAKEKGTINDDMWFKGYSSKIFFHSFHPPEFRKKILACKHAIMNRYKGKINRRNHILPQTHQIAK